MITFTLPIALPTFPSTLTLTVDRQPQLSRSVKLLEQKVDYGVLSQSRSDGINSVKRELNFKLANLPTITAKRVIDYFKTLKGSKTMTVSEDGTNVTYKVLNWTASLDSSLYITIVVSCEEHFNAAT